MKKTMVILLIAFSVPRVQAQGLGNFFSQKKADIQYMLDQIAALQVYIGYAEKGYNIAQKGLTFIGNLKKGEFDLHNAFFSSLKSVNPSIDSYSKVAAIISYQLAIISDFKNAIQRLKQSKNFNSSEVSYLNTVYSNMSAECTKSLSALIDVITDDTFQMTDNQRIQRIDLVFMDMKDKYAFTQSFTNEATLLAAQRENELNEIDFLKKLN
jgi:hypothetical protein